MNNFSYVNRTSISNIPDNLNGVIGDTVNTYKQIVSEEFIVSIYASGSLVRGNFQPGVSDFDTVAVLSRQTTEDELSKVKDLKLSLEKRWVSNGIEKIDIEFVTEVDLKNKNKMKFIYATDSTVIFGNHLAIKRDWPNPSNELSKMLNDSFEDMVNKYSKQVGGEKIYSNTFNLQRWVAKQAMRVIFGITMETSGEYTAKVQDYVLFVRKYLSTEIDYYEYLLEVYRSGEADDDKLLNVCRHVLAVAKHNNAI